MYFRLCKCRLCAQLLIPCSHLRSHCLSLASPFFLLHTSHLVPSTKGTILKYAFVETKAPLAILKHKEEAIVVQHITHLSHLLTIKSFQTLQSGHFLCTPSNLMGSNSPLLMVLLRKSCGLSVCLALLALWAETGSTNQWYISCLYMVSLT